MTPTKTNYQSDNNNKTSDSLVDTVRELANITRRDIERSYNINNTHSTEAYYSNRYGWMLRKTID